MRKAAGILMIIPYFTYILIWGTVLEITAKKQESLLKICLELWADGYN